MAMETASRKIKPGERSGSGAGGTVVALERAELERRLRREGLLANLQAAEGRMAGQQPFLTSRRYTASVVDLEAVDIRRTRVVGPSRAEPSETVRAILAKASARALYVLGFDGGQVELELGERGRAVIVGLAGRAAQQGGAPAERNGSGDSNGREEERVRVSKIKLGADPEFVIVTADGKVAPASRFFVPGGSAGCDSVVVRGVRRWPLAELRPEPEAEPDALVARLRQLLSTASRETAAGQPGYVWLAGALPVRGLPLGGHIHLSGVPLTSEALRALDNVVALPLRLLEPSAAASRRPRYGGLGDFRRQPHGGFEYRTPPSWLVSRMLARGALALAKIAAVHSRELAAYRPLDDDAVRDAFYVGDVTSLRKAFETVCVGVVSTAGYKSYAALINPLFEAIRSGRSWSETTDLRKKWGIPYEARNLL